jgi:hypothetical protein
MGIFDIFTGDPGKEAAERTRALLRQTQDEVTGRTGATKGEAAGYLTSGYGNARRNLGAGYGASNGAINAGARDALGYLDEGSRAALGALGQARGDLTANGGAYAPLTDLAGRYRGGSQLYADALGLGGADGNARAAAAFAAGPGYDFTLNQGLDAINRRRNAAGSLVSGNADIDALKYGQGLANQTYQQWLTNLAPYNSLELNATSGAASGNAGVGQTLANLGIKSADLLNATGQNKAQVAQGQGTTLADIANRYYAGLAGLDTSEGGALAGNATNATNAINAAALNVAPQIGKTFADEAAAEMAGSTNLWNLGFNLAKMALDPGKTANAFSGFAKPK